MSDEHSDRDRELPWRSEVVDDEAAVVTPSLDTVFDVLSDQERRHVCAYLLDVKPDVLTVGDMVADLADDETERRRLATALHHEHLPKLEATGVIEYDPRSRTVRCRGQPTVEKWVEHALASARRGNTADP